MTIQEFAIELAAWPPPIDVIRHELGLPDRWQLRASRALNQLLNRQEKIDIFTGVDHMWRIAIKGISGEPFNELLPPLYPWAPRPMRIR